MSTGRTRNLVLLAVFALGVAAVVTQLALLREMLSVFTGNELVLGIVLGNWLLLTGLGTALGRTAHRLRQPLRVLTGMQVLIAILPLLQVVALRTLRDVVFLPGAQIGVMGTLTGSFVVLAPFCLVSGYMLTLACAVLAERDEIGRVYVADNLGSILGGALFSLVLVMLLDHFGALLIPAVLNLSLAIIMGWVFGARVLGIVAAVLLASLGFMTDMDERTTALQYRGQQVVFRGNSPYGRLVVTESAGQRNFIENGVPLFSTHNTEQIEETVHYAMAQRPAARRVLLIGGGVSGTARELQKYPAAAVTYVELDPLILRVAGVAAVNTDGRLYVRQSAERFDVIIVDVPAPSTLQLNRYYTAEFFAETKRLLGDNGVLALSVGRYENYLSPELARLLATTHQTLRASYRHVLMLPGGRVFFLASDGGLTTEMAGQLPAGLKWLTPEYLEAMLTPDRLADLRRAIAMPVKLNRDYEPVLYFAQLRQWLRQFPVGFGVLEAGLLLVLFIYLLRLKAPALVVFAGGFAASVLQIVLLLGFQIVYGSLYRGLGLLVTLFMAGLAVGAWFANRRRVSLAWLAIGLGVLAVLLPVSVRIGWLIPLVTFGLAGLVGMEFPAACRLDTADAPTTAGRLFTADFVGACLGALLASTLLIPLVGVAAACWITAGLNVIAALALWWRR